MFDGRSNTSCAGVFPKSLDSENIFATKNTEITHRIKQTKKGCE